MAFPLIPVLWTAGAGIVSYAAAKISGDQKGIAQQQTQQQEIETRRQSTLARQSPDKIRALSPGAADDLIGLVKILALPVLLVIVGLVLITSGRRR